MDTFFWYWKLSAVCDRHLIYWFVSWVLWYVLDNINDVIALEDFTEHDVLSIEMTRTWLEQTFGMGESPLPWSRGCDEELRAIGVLSSVGHAEETDLGVLQLKVLVLELGAIDY